MFKRREVVNIQTLAPVILGARYENLTVRKVGIGIEDLKSTNPELYNTYNSLIPVIPGMSEINDLDFVVFETINGEMVIFATEWIASKEESNAETINYRITLNNPTEPEVNMVKDFLREYLPSTWRIEKVIVGVG